MPNERLRHHRLQRGWTLDGVAERLDALAPTVGRKHLGVNGTMVGRWERGERQPRGIYRGLLAVLYETTTEALGLYQPTTSERVLEEMQRRAFLQHMGAAAGVAVTSVAMEPWERLSAALRQPGRLDREIVSELEHVTVTLEGLESQVSPKALLGPVVGHLDTLASLLKSAPRPSLHQQLCSLAGETAGLAGWLTWDLEDRKAAGAYFRTGIQPRRRPTIGRLVPTWSAARASSRPTANGHRPGCDGSKDTRTDSLAATPPPAPKHGW